MSVCGLFSLGLYFDLFLVCFWFVLLVGIADFLLCLLCFCWVLLCLLFTVLGVCFVTGWLRFVFWFVFDWFAILVLVFCIWLFDLVAWLWWFDGLAVMGLRVSVDFCVLGCCRVILVLLKGWLGWNLFAVVFGWGLYSCIVWSFFGGVVCCSLF